MKLILLLLAGASSSSALISPLLPNHHRPALTTLTNRKKRSASRRRRRRRGPKHYYDADDLSQYDIDCPIYDDEPIDHAGLSKSIDEEYAAEEAKIDLTFWQILEREKSRVPSEFSSHMSPYERAKRRMEFKKGNIESKYELMTVRDYGNPDLLDKDHLREPPTLDDLNQTPATFSSTYWSQPLFRMGVVVTAYFSFPYWCKLFINFQTIDPKKFNIVVNQLAPNVGVLYATILALTLAVLYNRFTRIQENVTTEASLLSSLTRNVLSLFQDEPRWATDACQMIANQLRIMLSRTRGVELLSIMKADTYSNILALVDDYHYIHGCDDSFTPAQESTLGNIRSDLAHIMEVRALRLSDEASSLPPTHFLLLTSLSAVSSIAFVTASLAVIDDLNDPPEEARLLFAGLMALYVLFFNFCKDLNGPFQGVYQIKRSNAVSHLLQAKWLIVNQLGDSISFGEFGDTKGPPIRNEDGVIDTSFLDKVKRFFSGSDSEPEEITQVEANTMARLVKELDDHNKADDVSTLEGVQVSSSASSINKTNHGHTEEMPMQPTSFPSVQVKTENTNAAVTIEGQPTSFPSVQVKTENTNGAVTKEESMSQQISELCDTAEALNLSLDCSDFENTKAKPITVSNAPSTSAKLKQVDYAGYFRSVGGFS